jgi:hypothetical protein
VTTRWVAATPTERTCHDTEKAAEAWAREVVGREKFGSRAATEVVVFAVTVDESDRNGPVSDERPASGHGDHDGGERAADRGTA